tara:strand:+ start:93 stop:1157 length:1065 start_codon:yes stop_codon:yes gene_type:complete
MSGYLDALDQEIASTMNYFDPRPIGSSLYIGGGTPTLIHREQFKVFMDNLHSHIALTSNAEITVEMNPSDCSYEYLNTLSSCKVNRLSIGVQSFSDAELNRLGRTHSSKLLNAVIHDAKSAGIESVSIDLLYGHPGHTMESWKDTLESSIKLRPDHISCYALTLGSHRSHMLSRSLGLVIPDDEMVEFYGLATDLLSKAGYTHYETSNWALNGHQSEHNKQIWSGAEYMAFGCGAHAYIDKRRYSIIRHPQEYINSIASKRSVVDSVEKLTGVDLLVEAITLPLRTSDGINITELSRRFNYSIMEEHSLVISNLTENGLALLEKDRLHLTDKGLFLADGIGGQLLPNIVANSKT